MPAEPGSSRRLFFALWPDAKAAEDLYRQAREAQSRCDGRIMEKDSLHLTLAFLGEIPDECIPSLLEIGAAVAKGRLPVRLTMDRIDYWAHNRVLWAGCDDVPDELVALAVAVREGVATTGVVLPADAFVPHVTLLRKARNGTRLTLEHSVAWSSAELLLVESMRPPQPLRYRPVARWPLALPATRMAKAQ